MDRINSIEALKPLLKKPYFTSIEAKSFGIHPALLSYHVKKGSIKRISRGVYQPIDHEIEISFQWGDLIESLYEVKEGVICLISALAIYGLTDEIPRQDWIAVRHGTNVTKKPNRKILRFRNMDLGKTTINLDGTQVSIFDRERTIVDAFRLLSKEIAVKALRMALSLGGKDKIDLIKLQRYAKKMRVNVSAYLIAFTT